MPVLWFRNSDSQRCEAVGKEPCLPQDYSILLHDAILNDKKLVKRTETDREEEEFTMLCKEDFTAGLGEEVHKLHRLFNWGTTNAQSGLANWTQMDWVARWIEIFLSVYG